MSGQPTTYTNWGLPEPNDPDEPPAPSLYVRVYSLDHSQYPGMWDNLPDSWQAAGAFSGTNPSGVVETTVVEPVARLTPSPARPSINPCLSWIPPGCSVELAVELRRSGQLHGSEPRAHVLDCG